MDLTFIIFKFFGMIEQISYFELFLILALESTAFPIFIPVEAIVIPMGYLVFLKKRNLILLFFSIVSGILSGCMINYFTARKLGRPFLYKYGKYFMIKKKVLEKWEKRFLKNSNVIIFIGRFVPIPALKHIITLPAGLSGMKMKNFLFFNFLGACVFIFINLAIGYFFGGDIANINKIFHKIKYITLIIVILIVLYFVINNNKKNNKKSNF